MLEITLFLFRKSLVNGQEPYERLRESTQRTSFQILDLAHVFLFQSFSQCLWCAFSQFRCQIHIDIIQQND